MYLLISCRFLSFNYLIVSVAVVDVVFDDECAYFSLKSIHLNLNP